MFCSTILPAQDVSKSWGVRQLTLLEAEDRLSVVTEKGVTQDPVILALREVYQVSEALLWSSQMIFIYHPLVVCVQLTCCSAMLHLSS